MATTARRVICVGFWFGWYSRAVFAYLGRYTHRVGITNARIRYVDATAVVFETRNAKTTTVTPLEFMRRFMLHTLPAGFVKIRHYGLMAGRHVHTLLAKARDLLDLSASALRPRKEAKARTIAQALLSAETGNSQCDRLSLVHKEERRQMPN